MTRRNAYLVLLIASGTIISLCMGVRQSLGLYMAPIMRDVGVSAATFGFAIALQNIVWGISQPIVGAVADRYGPRSVLLVTGAVFAAGILLMAMAGSPLSLHLSGFMIGLGIAGTGFGVVIGVVTRATAPERRSRVVGVVSAAGSLGTMVLAPLAQMLIDTYGWRGGLIGFVGIALAMTLLTLLIRDQPIASIGPTVRHQSLRDALREAAQHKGFIAMTLAYFACGFQLVFVVTHLPQYLELCGISPTLGASALGLIGLFNTIGTLLFGYLGDHYSQKRLVALIYLLRTIAIILFVSLPISAASTLVFASVIGFLWLGVAPLVTGIISRMFGLAHFSMLFGLSFMSHQVGSFIGAWMGGWVFDVTGTYDWAWVALVVIGTIAFTLQWTMDDRPAQPRGPLRGAPAAA